MRKNETQTLGEVIKEYIEALKLSSRLKESRIINQWEELTGTMIAKRTQKIYIRNGILYLYMSSAAARNELMMIRNELIKRMNEKANEEIIKKIIIR